MLLKSPIADPTRDEMLAFLAEQPFADEFDEFDREAAIYWFASHYHPGQASNLYEVLSTSPYTPSPIASGVEPESAESFLYDALVSEYTI